MPYAEEVWRQLQMTMRSGVHPQTMVATTPRPLKLLIRLTQDPNAAVTIGASFENRANVARRLAGREPQDLRGHGVRRQEIGGEILEEMPGALFKREWFERTWCPDGQRSLRSAHRHRRRSRRDERREGRQLGDHRGRTARRRTVQVLEDATVNATPDVAARPPSPSTGSTARASWSRTSAEAGRWSTR